MDETTAPVLHPGRGQTKKRHFWAIVSDDRGHGSPSPPIVLFRYACGCSGAFAEQFLAGFNGRFLQCDGYDGYDRALGTGSTIRPVDARAWLEPSALAHSFTPSKPRPIAGRPAGRTQGAFAAYRCCAEPWFEKQLPIISSGATLAEDIRYALTHWPGLTRFLDDGRLELDTKPAENAIRPICLTRKTALFAGHEVGAEKIGLCLRRSLPPANSTT